jgi:hypothetical protein
MPWFMLWRIPRSLRTLSNSFALCFWYHRDAAYCDVPTTMFCTDSYYHSLRDKHFKLQSELNSFSSNSHLLSIRYTASSVPPPSKSANLLQRDWNRQRIGENTKKETTVTKTNHANMPLRPNASQPGNKVPAGRSCQPGVSQVSYNYTSGTVQSFSSAFRRALLFCLGMVRRQCPDE